MLSAYSQKVSELEAKLEEHEKTLGELKQHLLENHEKEKEDPVKNIPKEIQRILLSFQGELKDQSFVVNTVQSKVQTFKDELSSFRQFIYENLAKQSDLDFYVDIVYDLRTDLDNLITLGSNLNDDVEESIIEPPDIEDTEDNGADVKNSNLNPNVEDFKPRVSLTGNDTMSQLSLNPNAVEFKPRNSLPGNDSTSPGHLPSPTAGKENAKIISAESQAVNTPRSRSIPTPSTYAKNQSLRERRVSLPEYLSEEEYNEIKKEFMLPSGQSPDLDDINTKDRVTLLEIELSEKEEALQAANEKLTSMCITQEEMLKKMEWLEHKVRLLKQDKRRRGDTIGKLLRCVDDLRTCGLLDFTRATAERAILTSTLSTRGMPHEERIQVAINVTEAEQLHQYCPDDNSPKFNVDGLEIPNSPLSGKASTLASDTSLLSDSSPYKWPVFSENDSQDSLIESPHE